MPWYYANSGQRQGPLDEAAFNDLVRGGTIGPDTLVWHEGMTAWQRWATVNESGSADAAGDDTAVCAVSGKRFPKREMIHYQGKWISAEQKDAFFQRMREGIEEPGTFVYGGFWKRFVAKFADGIIVWICTTAINIALAVVFFGGIFYGAGLARQAAPNPGRFFVYQAVSLLVNLGLGLGYYTFFLYRYAATPGKMMLGLKIVRSDGSALSIGRIVGRYFSEWISGMLLALGYIMAAFDEQKRALHDRICDTRVVASR